MRPCAFIWWQMPSLPVGREGIRRDNDMGEKMTLSGVPETMLQTIYARAKESRARHIAEIG